MGPMQPIKIGPNTCIQNVQHSPIIHGWLDHSKGAPWNKSPNACNACIHVGHSKREAQELIVTSLTQKVINTNGRGTQNHAKETKSKS